MERETFPTTSETPKIPEISFQVFYAPTNELMPLTSSDLSLESIEGDINCSQWVRACTAMLSLRRLVRFNRMLAEPRIAEMLHATLKQTRNLRSVVSKTSLLCIADILLAFKADLLFPSEESARSCLRSLLELNLAGKIFIAKESTVALQRFRQSLPPKQFARIALAEVLHNNPGFRAELVHLLLLVLEEHSSDSGILVR